MRRFLLRRLGGTLLSVAGLVVVVTLFLDFLPGDPIEILLGEQAAAIDRAAMRRALGLDAPVPLRIARFARDFSTGDLRTSLPPFVEPVLPRIAEKLPRTLLLAATAMALALAIALPLGVASARRPGSWTDRAAMTAALAAVCLPQAWLGPALIWLFAIHLGWLPALGDRGLASLVLPSVTLGLALAAVLSRMTRASLLDVDREDYVRTARAKGLGEDRVMWKHAGRNALVPVVTVAGLQLGALLTGSIVTEKVFDWPGLGTLLLTAIGQRDYNLVRACVLVYALIYAAVNLVTDLACAAADPRVREASLEEAR